MQWKLIEDVHITTEGEYIVRYWIKTVQGEHISLELVAGDLRESEPNEYRQDTSDYTVVKVRAYSKATGAFLCLSSQSYSTLVPINKLTQVLNALEAYEGVRHQAYTALADIL